MKRALQSMAALTAALGFATGAQATMTYDDTLTSAFVNGTGMSNTTFAIDREQGIELALRARVRYPAPIDEMRSQGGGVYGSFAAGPAGGPATRSSWNFDWSVNSDYVNNTASIAQSGLSYFLGMDFNSASGNAVTYEINLVTGSATGCFDHSFGNNGTAQGAGTEAGQPTPFCDGATPAADFSALVGANNVMQNSWNLDFFNELAAGMGGELYNNNAPGEYSIYLVARRGTAEVARADILVTVPEPGSLALVGLALAGVAGVSRRRRS